jgi:hypothetical protein
MGRGRTAIKASHSRYAQQVRHQSRHARASVPVQQRLAELSASREAIRQRQLDAVVILIEHRPA